uniref:SSD domain-containing protein n=1 Tax=Bursaphelenchus xylophilus TaxID=6326 RepID=A0A1I7SKH7_BURXY
LVYALYSQINRDSCCLLAAESAVGLAFAGVLTVTFASVAGLGLVTWFGVEFNAATTQIVPFLTLGIGVDNMFMLLHNYHRVFTDVKKSELGLLLKETGMSILMTSTNNILSFLTGTVLPIPALRSFCLQSSVLLTFNLVAILTVYPAIIAIDINRRKSARRDVCCCLKSSNATEQDVYDDPPYGYDLTGGVPTVLTTKPHYHGLISVGKGDDEEAEEIQPWSLRAFLRNYYVPFLSNNCVKVSGDEFFFWMIKFGFELNLFLKVYIGKKTYHFASGKYQKCGKIPPSPSEKTSISTARPLFL